MLVLQMTWFTVSLQKVVHESKCSKLDKLIVEVHKINCLWNWHENVESIEANIPRADWRKYKTNHNIYERKYTKMYFGRQKSQYIYQE